jgi:hypothetical protein
MSEEKDWIQMAQEEDTCEDGNESSGSLKGGEFHV